MRSIALAAVAFFVMRRTRLGGAGRHQDEKIKILTAKDDEHETGKEFVENTPLHFALP